jgi:flagellar hook-length control protein FliK
VLRAESNAGPIVDRQAVVDQAVRFAKLSLEHGLSRFEMRLEPPGLGRLGVVMDLRDGGLNITFRVENEAVREALQNSLPQLRDALSGQGVNVSGCDVFSSARGGRQQEGTVFQQVPGSPAGESFGSDTGGASAEVQAVRAGRGLVDCWA